MLDFVRCNLCGDTQYEVLHRAKSGSNTLNASEFTCTSIKHGNFGQIVRCRKCGLIYRNPRESSEELTDVYKNTIDDVYSYEARGRYLTFRKLLEFVSLYGEPGYLCDVGCYTGIFLDLAKEEGWKVFGIEPSVWASAEARKMGLRVINGTLEKLHCFDTRFDAVTMWDTIEHLSDPAGSLRTIGDNLKDNGLLFFTTMDTGSLFVKCLGKKWPWFMKMHLYYFTRETMTDMLKECGFTVLCIKTYSHIVSLRYLIHKIINSLSLSKSFSGPYDKLSLIPDLYVPVNFGDFMLVAARKA